MAPAEGGSEVERLFGGEGTAIVGQPLDGAWRLDRGEAQFHRLQHQIAHHLPLTPAPATACQASTSQSWASMAKTMRTISPFQQVISKTTEHQRRFERITTTLPSCRRPLRRPVWR